MKSGSSECDLVCTWLDRHSCYRVLGIKEVDLTQEAFGEYEKQPGDVVLGMLDKIVRIPGS